MGLSNENYVPWRNPLVARELALGITATLIFFFSILFVPMVGIFVGIFTPLPTLLSLYRMGRPKGYWIPAGAAVAGWLLLSYLSIPQSMPYLLEMLLLGVFLGMGMRRQWPMEFTIGGASLLAFGLAVMVFYFGHHSVDGSVFKSLEEGLQQAIKLTFQYYGGDSPEMRVLEYSILKAVPVVVRMLPGALLASVLVISWLNVLVTRQYCRVHHLPGPSWVEWQLWKTPEPLVWGVIISGFMLLVRVESLKLLALNMLIVLGTIYLFQGMAVIAFYFERWKLPRLLRAILYGLLVLQQFASIGAIFLGLFDVWFDFRRLAKKPAPESESGSDSDPDTDT